MLLFVCTDENVSKFDAMFHLPWTTLHAHIHVDKWQQIWCYVPSLFISWQ